MLRKILSCTLLVLGLMFASCQDEKEELVTLKTQFGEIKMILFDDTPLHKENFLELVRSGKLDSTTFHRVIPGFMVQGGDITEQGSEEPEQVPPEFSEHHIHERGAVAAARRGDAVNPEKKSSGSQFYIVQGKIFTKQDFVRLKEDHMLNQLQPHFSEIINRQSNNELRQRYMEAYEEQDAERLRKIILETRPKIEDEFGEMEDLVLSPEQIQTYSTIGGAPHLDKTYTVFGMVVDGMDVVDQIARQRTDRSGKPVREIYMTASVEEVSKDKITQEYGYEYEEEK